LEQDNAPEVKGCANLATIYSDDQYALYEIRP
jgi:hypothetical protein